MSVKGPTEQHEGNNNRLHASEARGANSLMGQGHCSVSASNSAGFLQDAGGRQGGLRRTGHNAYYRTLIFVALLLGQIVAKRACWKWGARSEKRAISPHLAAYMGGNHAPVLHK